MQFQIFMAGIEDVDLLVQHRLSMFEEIFPELKTQVNALNEKTRVWIKQKISEGSLIGFIAKTQGGQVVGSGCVWMREEPPGPKTLALKEPYLMSMYTEKAFRGKRGRQYDHC